MNTRQLKQARHQRRRLRVRRRVVGTPERPRLSVFRSLNHISAQIIDDIGGRTLASAGTHTKALADQVRNGGNCKAAEVVGRILAERARMQGIKKVCFDRGGRMYHGRIKALAEAARKTGLEF